MGFAKKPTAAGKNFARTPGAAKLYVKAFPVRLGLKQFNRRGSKMQARKRGGPKVNALFLSRQKQSNELLVRQIIQQIEALWFALFAIGPGHALVHSKMA